MNSSNGFIVNRKGIGMILTMLMLQIVKGQELKVNDTVPYVEFTEVLNYGNKTLHLSDFKNKAIIVAFWSHSCNPCLKELPLLDSLQKIFKDQLQIILVNKESKDSTLHFFATRNRIRKPDIPLVTDNVGFCKLFPFTGVPTHAWINSDGIFKFIDGGNLTTYDNIKKFLTGHELFLSQSDEKLFFDSPLRSPWKESAIHYSYLGHYVKNFHVKQSSGSSFVISANGASIVDLYTKAFKAIDKTDYAKPGRLILNVNDTGKYQRPKSIGDLKSWQQNNCYSYYLSVDLSQANEAYWIMKNDIDKFFDLSAKLEHKWVKCLTLIGDRFVNKVRTKGGESLDSFIPIDLRASNLKTRYEIRNLPYERFISKLGNLVEEGLNRPFVNRTAYDGNIDIVLDRNQVDSLDIKKINRELGNYNLTLVEQYCMLDVLVITDHDKANTHSF
jgi:thiol-disulfide isomerase/thioredoxin